MHDESAATLLRKAPTPQHTYARYLVTVPNGGDGDNTKVHSISHTVKGLVVAHRVLHRKQQAGEERCGDKQEDHGRAKRRVRPPKRLDDLPCVGKVPEQLEHSQDLHGLKDAQGRVVAHVSTPLTEGRRALRGAPERHYVKRNNRYYVHPNQRVTNEFAQRSRLHSRHVAESELERECHREEEFQ